MMSGLEDVPKFEERSNIDVAVVRQLASLVLSEKLEPAITPGGSLGLESTFEWNEGQNAYAIGSVINEQNIHLISALKVEYSSSGSSVLLSTTYTLLTAEQAFMVERERFHDNQPNPDEFTPEAEQRRSRQSEEQFDEGQLMPRPGDWEDFIKLIARGVVHKS